MSNALNLGSIVLPGDNYPSIFGFNIPVTSGLEGAYLFGDGLNQVGRNYAPGKSNAMVSGGPVAGGGFASFGSGYLNTGISETADMTIISVCRDSSGFADPQPGFVGNNISLVAGGVALATGSGGAALRGQAVKDALSDYATVAATTSNFVLVAYRARSSVASQISNLTSGVSAVAASTGVRTIDPSPILVGRLPSLNFQGPNDQAVCLIYSRALTDAELSLVAAWVRGYCTSKGITV
ncbi:hypothetical protein HA62_23365 [Pseudomonas putida]|nr:hypothetical protein HA62_23365 [Pseudomonas putida]